MFKGLNVRYFLLFVLFLESNVSLALQPIITLSAGASLSQLGQSASFTPLDLCRYSYKPQRSNTITMLWGGFVGTDVKRSPSWEFIAGLGYYQPNALSTTGALTQGADAASDSIYNYRYQTQSQQLLAEGKLYWLTKETMHPFLMMGVGASFNKTSDYQTNVPPFLEFTPVFYNHTQTNFTYAIGPGIDINLSNSLRMGIAYRFTDLGSVNTGSAQMDGIPISNTLKQSHVYANQILAQFTFMPWALD